MVRVRVRARFRVPFTCDGARSTGDHLMDIIKRPFATEEIADNTEGSPSHDNLMASVIRLKEENSTYRRGGV